MKMNPKKAYRPSTKWDVNMLFYDVNVCMDYIESKGYICNYYIIFRMKNFSLI